MTIICMYFLELDEKSCSYHNLPKGWEKINHDSGMPIYMNTETRVCSFSKPFSWH